MSRGKDCKEFSREAPESVSWHLCVIICLTPMLQFLSVTGFKEAHFKMPTTAKVTGQPSDYTDIKPAGEETVWKNYTHMAISAQDLS